VPACAGTTKGYGCKIGLTFRFGNWRKPGRRRSFSPMIQSWVGPAAAIFEVLGVYGAGGLIGSLLARLLGIELTNPLQSLVPGTDPSALVSISAEMTKGLLIQYAGYFLAIIPIGYWHRRRGPAGYGLTLGGRPLGWLVAAGVLTYAAGQLLGRVVNHVGSFVDLGETVPWRTALFQMSLGRWEVWLFYFVLGFGLVAVLEELFFRGYIQARLAEDLGHPSAIVVGTSIFAFSHGQYLLANVYSIGTLIALIVGALGFGIVFARTGSLVPSIVAHALVNTPNPKNIVGWLITGAMVVICLVAWAALRGAIAAFLRDLRAVPDKRLLAIATVVFGAAAVGYARSGPMGPYLALAALVIALGLEAVDKRLAAGAAV
jgi:membrane protease YdiL (CAAX protease family)